MSTTDLMLKRLEQELRPIARQRIANGQLPREVLTRVSDGCGTGRLCSLCDRPIQPGEPNTKLSVSGRPLKRFGFTGCHYAWQLECARVKRRPRLIPRNPH
jgi:hypothetical protein